MKNLYKRSPIGTQVLHNNHFHLFISREWSWAVLLLLMLTFFCNVSIAQNLSSKVMGTSNDQTKVNILKTNSGDYVINCTVDATYDSCMVVKIDANLNTIWSNRYGFTGKNIKANKVFEKEGLLNMGLMHIKYAFFT